MKNPTEFERKIRTFKCYGTLFERLKKIGLERPGRYCSFLLSVFVEQDGRLYAEQVAMAGLLGNLTFKDWRKKMIVYGIIDFKVYLTKENKTKYFIYKPGHKLIDLVNKEKMLRSSVVTEDSYKEDYLKLESKLKSLQKEVSVHKNSLKAIIEYCNPPFTEEKYKKLLSDPLSITLFFKKKGDEEEEEDGDKVIVINDEEGFERYYQQYLEDRKENGIVDEEEYY